MASMANTRTLHLTPTGSAVNRASTESKVYAIAVELDGERWVFADKRRSGLTD